jgi:hypothetical protein
MKLANLLAPLALLATLAAAEPTLHTLQTTWNNTAMQSTNFAIPAGYSATIRTLTRLPYPGSQLIFANDTLNGLDLEKGDIVRGPGRLYAASRPVGSSTGEQPQQLVVVELRPVPSPTLAVVERSVDLTNWMAVGQVWLVPDADAPQLFYRLNVPKSDVR